MTVYMVNMPEEKRLDLSAALLYGDVRYVNHKYVFGDEIDDERLPPAFVQNMERCVDEFDPDCDYLLIAGDHLQLVAFTAMLAAKFSYFKVLRYDRHERAYIPVRIEPHLLEPRKVPA